MCPFDSPRDRFNEMNTKHTTIAAARRRSRALCVLRCLCATKNSQQHTGSPQWRWRLTTPTTITISTHRVLKSNLLKSAAARPVTPAAEPVSQGSRVSRHARAHYAINNCNSYEAMYFNKISDSVWHAHGFFFCSCSCGRRQITGLMSRLLVSARQATVLMIRACS